MHARRSSPVAQVPRLPSSIPNAPKPDTNSVSVPPTPMKMVKRATSPPAILPAVPDSKALVPNTPKRAMSVPPSVPVLAASSIPRQLPAAPADNDTPAAPAAPNVPDPEAETKALPLPDTSKQSTPAPADPKEETKAHPKRDVTDPDQLEDDFSPELALDPLAARSNSDDVSEPMEHPPIHRQHFRDMAAPVTEPADTAVNAESGSTMGQESGKSDSTVVEEPSVAKPLTTNSDTPVAQTYERKRPDDSSVDDIAVAGTSSGDQGQALHQSSTTQSDGKKTTDTVVGGDLVHEHKESGRAL
ncbi:hypothetical protein B0H16DRAFT_280949 [Mycena metata]|uniref:Uncharacterized protein n=1 Tax=Mycena metata TaxID=1033252 RepID=A0AAD7HPN4_9AGAR|nr:hypothetical protein B0H16DRAFT_280949 [Mycena metata]